MKLFQSFRLRLIALLASALMLAGCQEVLYSQLSEADANEMVALLQLSGVPASRERDKSDLYSVLVDEESLAVAVTILRNAGLPREKFATLGEVFGEGGVVGTPFEDSVRFAFATNEELQHTLTQIKGIDRARVHVVIPTKERFNTETKPARASVAIFHDQSFAPSQFSSRIKTLVAFAVPDLEIENVSITYFESPGFVVQPLGEVAGLGEAQANGSGTIFSVIGNSTWPIAEIMMVVAFVILVRFLVLLRRGVSRIFRGRQNA